MWPVTDDRLSDLRLFPQQAADETPRDEMAVCWETLEQAFREGTGFTLAGPAGEVRRAENGGVAEAGAAKLAERIRQLCDQRAAALDTLRQREAELATVIPVVLRQGGGDELARRLEAVLRDAAAMLNCFAAAVYMLDDDTSQLKLRVGWGLPTERLMEAARPLRGAISDLEAMLGHIVLLDDTSKLPHWRAPERAAAAACVPLSSSSTPLGTLWFFADQPRGFTEDDGRLLEIVAGRVVAELEREAVSRERALARHVETQLGRARQWQDNRLPTFTPAVAGWEVAGWSAQSQRVGGDFHGWQALPDQSLGVWLGHAQGGMLEAALTSASLQGSLAVELRGARFAAGGNGIVESLSEALWNHSAGDQQASLSVALVNPNDGRMRFTSAGPTGAVLVRPEAAVLMPSPHPSLGERPELAVSETSMTIHPGDLLLLYSEGVTRVTDGDDRPFDAALLTELLSEQRDLTARQLVDHARLLLQADGRNWSDEDCTIVVLRRVPGH
jgi:serine phosphatase RsbU (regulator of sigma subunit)